MFSPMNWEYFASRRRDIQRQARQERLIREARRSKQRDAHS